MKKMMIMMAQDGKYLVGFVMQVHGYHGAAVIAEKFRKDGVQFEFILDEGLTILENMIPGVVKPVALYALEHSIIQDSQL